MIILGHSKISNNMRLIEFILGWLLVYFWSACLKWWVCCIDDPLPEPGNIHTKNLQNQCGHQGKVHKERPTQLYYY